MDFKKKVRTNKVQAEFNASLWFLNREYWDVALGKSFEFFMGFSVYVHFPYRLNTISH